MTWRVKKVCRPLITLKTSLLLFLSSVVVSAFVSLVGLPVGIVTSAVGLKICAINEGIKKDKSIIKKKRKKNNKVELLSKPILKPFEVLIFEVLLN